MSSAFVHIGQCGNQIGCEYWKLVESEQRASPNLSPLLSISNSQTRTASCVMIDSEPKVIMANALKLKRIFDVASSSAIDSSGRANNWAMGYFSCFPSPKNNKKSKNSIKRPAFTHSTASPEPNPSQHFSHAINLLRKKIELSDRLTTITLTHSLGGGTGSGMSSAILQYLRDNYPSLYLTTTAVAPFTSGDTPLQHYNSIFSLQYERATIEATRTLALD